MKKIIAFLPVLLALSCNLNFNKKEDEESRIQAVPIADASGDILSDSHLLSEAILSVIDEAVSNAYLP